MTVKRIILAFLFLFCLGEIYAQVDLAARRQEAYWNYRNRLKRDFNKIGRFPGNSLTINVRSYGNGFWPFACPDTLQGRDGYGWKGIVEWGDALALHGQYLAMLATEYKLLVNNNQPTDETLIELYYAIAALTRIDKAFDAYHLSTNPASESGVLLRDDIPLTIVNNWTFLEPVTNQPFIIRSEAVANYSRYGCVAENNKPHNIWSKDHIANLLFGLCMVKKFTDNVYVRPTLNDPGFYLHNEIKRIVNIWMQKFSNGHTFQYESLCGTVSETQNWVIYNDITDEPAGDTAGFKLGNVAYPFSEMANFITDNEYDYTDAYVHAKSCPDLVLGYTTWLGLKQEWNLYEAASGDGIIPGLVLATNNSYHDLYRMKINNLSTVFPIAAVSGLVSHTRLGNLTKYQWSGDINPYAVWELAYCQFKNVYSIWSKSEVEAVLDLAPLCTNPANGYKGNQLTYWVKDNVGLHGLRPSGDDPWGYFNGIDYMLMYNLYRLQFCPNPDQEGGYSERSCEGKQSDVIQIVQDPSVTPVQDQEVMIWPAHFIKYSYPIR